MRPVNGLSPEQVLGQRITPEQSNIWQRLFTLMRVSNTSIITPVVLNVTSTGSELLTYAATKLYFAYELKITPVNIPATALVQNTNLMDETNNLRFYAIHRVPYWDATAAAARYSPVNCFFTNVWFSRLEVSEVCYIYFNGYRIDV